jgi:hypothetical protein
MMAIVLLYMFPPTVRKSNYSYALSEVYFYDLKNSRHFGIRNQILRDSQPDVFESIELDVYRKNRDKKASVHVQNRVVTSHSWCLLCDFI